MTTRPVGAYDMLITVFYRLQFRFKAKFKPKFKPNFKPKFKPNLVSEGMQRITTSGNAQVNLNTQLTWYQRSRRRSCTQNLARRRWLVSRHAHQGRRHTPRLPGTHSQCTLGRHHCQLISAIGFKIKKMPS